MGIGEALFSGYISADYKDFFVFAVLVGIVVVRPKGILGQKG
jgi:branched-subunit amino acid ABC-type transport system permease component